MGQFKYEKKWAIQCRKKFRGLKAFFSLHVTSVYCQFKFVEQTFKDAPVAAAAA